MNEDDIKWADAQEASIDEGIELIKEASNEALEYIQDALEHLDDRAWRKMVVESQAIEMGVGKGLAEHLVPVVYKDMQKTLHKKLKIKKSTALAVRHIYIGRVIKNIQKELSKRNG